MVGASLAQIKSKGFTGGIAVLPTPKKFTLVTGTGRGESRLNAFDRALLQAGIGNLNLIKVSSILPPGSDLVEHLEIPPGSLTPVAYGALISDEEGGMIAASIAVGISENDYGLIMEFSGKCSRQEAEARALAMVREGFSVRGLKLKASQVKAVEEKVQGHTCVFAGAVLWY